MVLLVRTTRETASSEWKSSPPHRSKKFSIDRRKGKFMLEGILTARTFSIDSSSLKIKPVNKEMYTDILRRLGDAVRRKRPEKLRSNSLFLLHDNAPAHRSVLVKDF
jgi:hypothetical protein